MNEELINEVALITGASRGLGKFLSLELAKKGIETILVSRTVGALEELYDEIKKIGANSTIVPLDLNNSDAIDNLGFCLLYTSDGCRRSTLCRSRWSPYH